MLFLGLSYILPEKRCLVQPNDHPWINEDLCCLIQLRQHACFSRNHTLFKFYRNRVNRKRKTCQANYYKTKVDNLKQSNLKHWWREVKRISGMVSHSSLQNCIQSENLEHLSVVDLANAINNAFLESMQEFDPFNPNDDQPNSMSDQPVDITTLWETHNKLKLLSTSKAPGPNEVPNFVYKEYAKILACPISSLVNCSLRHQ